MRLHSTFRSLLLRSLAFALAVLVLMPLATSAPAFGQFRVAITFGPPAIPVYEQPVCPGDGYIWTPGYWYWDDDAADYYWVPGTWILAPEVGFLWTPGWWGWGTDAFLWHEGFWGPQIGFYGGINYGFGYFGVGFVGGRWDGGHFFYNRDVMNVNVTEIHNVYNEHVNITNNNRVAFNGGNGGIEARPTSQEEAAMNGRHVGPISAQTQHVQEARSNPQLRASANQGRPPIAATARPGDFKTGVVAARDAGAPYHAPANRGGEARGTPAEHPENGAAAGRTPVHPNDLPPVDRGTAPSSGNAKADQKYQKQQAKLASQQDKERQKLQQQQDKEHAQLTQQHADAARTQQVEQKHQQQTQALQQRHQTQQQHLQSHAPAKR